MIPGSHGRRSRRARRSSARRVPVPSRRRRRDTRFALSTAPFSSSTCTASPRSPAFSAAGVPSTTTFPCETIASALGELVSLLQVVRREQDRQALLPASRDTSSHMTVRASGSRPGRRLVQEEHARTVHEPERDVEPAPHAARVPLTIRSAASAMPTSSSSSSTLAAQVAPPIPCTCPCSRGSRGRCRLLHARVLRHVADQTTHGVVLARASWPATVRPAESGLVSVTSMRTVVDLPAPFGPSSPNTSPSVTEKRRRRAPAPLRSVCEGPSTTIASIAARD